MTEKKRVTVYVTADLWDRAKKVVQDDLQGSISLSQMVDNMLRDMVPLMEESVSLAKAGDKSALLDLLDRFVSRNLGVLGAEHHAVRQQLALQVGKEGDG